MTEIIVDATNCIVGRLGAYVAKQALLGNTVRVVNAEKAVMTGNPRWIVDKYYHRRVETGRPGKGPYILRAPDRFLRRQFRGMLPHKKARGSAAFKRILCYEGVPGQFANKKLVVVKEASTAQKRILKFTSVEKLCRALGERR